MNASAVLAHLMTADATIYIPVGLKSHHGVHTDWKKNDERVLSGKRAMPKSQDLSSMRNRDAHFATGSWATSTMAFRRREQMTRELYPMFIIRIMLHAFFSRITALRGWCLAVIFPTENLPSEQKHQQKWRCIAIDHQRDLLSLSWWYSLTSRNATSFN